jgi:hypothetical protein
MIALPFCSDLAARPSRLNYAYLEAGRRQRSKKISPSTVRYFAPTLAAPGWLSF